MLRNAQRRLAGRAVLLEEVYAPTTRRARSARELTLRRLTAVAKVPFLPISSEALVAVAAALKGGGYRSGHSYIALWDSSTGALDISGHRNYSASGQT